jgi:two-component system phosphate regulon response regulator PhoB
MRPRVLVVEDDSALLRIVTASLRQAGLETMEASDGDAALSLMQLVPPDLVLADWKMPKMNGLELCRAVKINDQLKSIPVVIISGMDERDALHAIVAAGADHFIQKPFRPDDLVIRVKAVLERAGRGEAS